MTDTKEGQDNAIVGVGIDVGGTFTDVVALERNGSLVTTKVRSTPDGFAAGIGVGVSELVKSGNGHESGGSLRWIKHATTVVTNAIIERKGARVGLLTTAGFRDVLELGRLKLPKTTDFLHVKPSPLAPRQLRREVDERTNAEGIVERAPDRKAVLAELDVLVRAKVEAIAIAFLHSYANDANERLVAEWIAAARPELDVCVSSELVPEIGEYERTSTAVINACARPVMGDYLNALTGELSSRAITSPVFVLQSNASLTSLRTAAQRPFQLVESGPAAGVLAAKHLLRAVGAAGDAGGITFDMGGTTAKAALIQGDEIRIVREYEVGGSLAESSSFMGSGGLALRAPVVDLAEVGAGGGSFASVDEAGAIAVGPESAGAVPGPACYGAGGTAATLTDANVVLGYQNPEALLGGGVPLDLDAAAAAIARDVAHPLGVSIERAAAMVHQVANSSMLVAVKAVTSQRGRDPREFPLIAFGGNGPLHGPGLARILGARTIIVPPNPGVFSAAGLLFATQQTEVSKVHCAPLAQLDFERVNGAFSELETQAASALDGVSSDAVDLERRMDLRYVGQGEGLTVRVTSHPLTENDLPDLEAAFVDEHLRTYRHAFQAGAVEVLTLRVLASARSDDAPTFTGQLGGMPGGGARRVWFGDEPYETPIVTRADLDDSWSDGPLILDEFDSTTVVPPGARARAAEAGCVLIRHEAEL